MSLLGRVRKLFGPSAAPAKGKVIARTYVTSKTDRAQVIADAMAVYRRERVQVRAALESALKRLRDEAPGALRNPDGLTRLLSIHRAQVGLRQMMASDNKRFLVLSGLREMLGASKAGAETRKPSRRVITKR